MPKDRELIVETVVYANNLFAHIGGQFISTDKLGPAGGCGENAGLQKRLSLRIEQRRGNLIARKRLTRRQAQSGVLGLQCGGKLISARDMNGAGDLSPVFT